MLYSDGRWYKGAFISGAINGVGVMTYPSGERYEGTFANGMPVAGANVMTKYQSQIF